MKMNYNNSYGHHNDSRLDEIKNLLKEQYVFRKNEIYDRLEYRKQDEEGFHLIDSYTKNSLLLNYLSDNHLYCSRKTMDMLLNSDFSEPYNPLKEFAEHLPEWDEVDYFQQLAKTLDTNNNDLFLDVLRKWFVSLSGSLISENKVINHIFPILTGGQRMEKTIWIRKLVPQGLQPFYFEGAINPSTMDDRKKFVENAVIYLIELQPETNQKKFEELKLFIASKEKVRRIYSKNAASRRASIIGTTEQHLNNDIIGNKMVICFEVKSVDYKHQIPMEMVFAQALCLYKNNFPYQFSVEEMTQMNKDQEQEKKMNIQELVSMYIEPSPRDAEDTVNGTATNIAKLSSSFQTVEDVEAIDDFDFLQTHSKQFIEANTREATLQHLKNDCIIPVFSKDNELTVSHISFIETVFEAACKVFPREKIGIPEIRVSHNIKGRIPEAANKSVHELLERDKTLYYERMAFVIEIPSICDNINGNLLNLNLL